MSLPTPAPWMDTQLVLPGQMQLATPPAAATLSMQRLSDESLQERLRSLETECQQLRDSNSRLELENSKLKLQVSSSQGSQSVSGKLESPSRLNGSISVAETQHQDLRKRMRAMMEEQRRLVDELQLEIAEVRVPSVNVCTFAISVLCFFDVLLLPGPGPASGSTWQRAPAGASAQRSKQLRRYDRGARKR